MSYHAVETLAFLKQFLLLSSATLMATGDANMDLDAFKELCKPVWKDN